MFLLSNINDRRYSEVYIGLRNVAFDMSEIQLRNAKNRDWNEINPGSIVCVVNSTRKISTFRRIELLTKRGLMPKAAEALGFFSWLRKSIRIGRRRNGDLERPATWPGRAIAVKSAELGISEGLAS